METKETMETTVRVEKVEGNENQQVLIVQKESYLEQLIVKGKIDLDFLPNPIQTA